MNILFTLCGRAGSKGVKGKNARDFMDVPLCWFSLAGVALYIEKYKKDGDHIDVALNTDSAPLIQLIEQADALPVMIHRRDASLGGDRVPKVAVIRDSFLRAMTETGIDYDMVVDLDITSPLRRLKDIRNAIEKKAGRDDVDVTYSVTAARRNPYFNMAKEVDGYFSTAIPSHYTARQQAPVVYDMNASIYAYSPRALREKDAEAFFDNHCDAIVMPDTGILDIDSEEDYELMQVIARHLFNNVEGYKEIYEKVISWKK